MNPHKMFLDFSFEIAAELSSAAGEFGCHSTELITNLFFNPTQSNR